MNIHSQQRDHEISKKIGTMAHCDNTKRGGGGENGFVSEPVNGFSSQFSVSQFYCNQKRSSN